MTPHCRTRRSIPRNAPGPSVRRGSRSGYRRQLRRYSRPNLAVDADPRDRFVVCGASSRSTWSTNSRCRSRSRRRNPVTRRRYVRRCGSVCALASDSSSRSSSPAMSLRRAPIPWPVASSPTRSAISRRRSSSLFIGVKRTGVSAQARSASRPLSVSVSTVRSRVLPGSLRASR